MTDTTAIQGPARASRSRQTRFGGRFEDAPMLDLRDSRNLHPVNIGELHGYLESGNVLTGARIEAVKRVPQPLYVLYVNGHWRPAGYKIFEVNRPERPRFFRDVDRIIALLRVELQYDGKIELVESPQIRRVSHVRSRSRITPVRVNQAGAER